LKDADNTSKGQTRPYRNNDTHSATHFIAKTEKINDIKMISKTKHNFSKCQNYHDTNLRQNAA